MHQYYSNAYIEAVPIPSPLPYPGNRGAFAHVVSSRGAALAILLWPGGCRGAFAYPGATPGHLTHVFESAMDVHQERQGVCRTMACRSILEISSLLINI